MSIWAGSNLDGLSGITNGGSHVTHGRVVTLSTPEPIKKKRRLDLPDLQDLVGNTRLARSEWQEGGFNKARKLIKKEDRKNRAKEAKE